MSVPIGSIVSYGGPVNNAQIASLADQGWLFCDGGAYDQQQYEGLYGIIGKAYGGDETHFNVPDLRGRFARGVDNGSKNDPDADSRTASASGGNNGDSVGSYQDDEFKSHKHDINLWWRSFEGDFSKTKDQVYDNKGAETGYSGSTGGNETRPKNVYVNWIIKAFNSSK
ncbi:MAG: phage tail protein [Cytophagales bacterium]|nr:phage tail protein [Cytophagales bacterium]